MSVTFPTGVTLGDIRAELNRILASRAFGASERHQRFLSFIVDETLAGRAERIKAYTIATSAFDRGENFDPQNDSIVRIEAGRLRRALDHYYLTEGKADRIRILIPKGTYVPQFVLADDALSNAEPKRPALPPHRGPRIFVWPFEQDSGNGDFTAGFTRQVIMGLTRFSNVSVFGAARPNEQQARPELSRLSEDFNVDFVLFGTVEVTDRHLIVDLLLQQVPNSRYVWTERFERDLVPAEIRQLRDEIAAAVVRTLAQPYGILFCRVLDNEGEAPERIGSYRAVLDFYRYLQSFDKALFDPVRRGLEQAINDDPTFAEAYACLSKIYTNAARFGVDFAEVASNPLDRALDLARKAIALAPNSSSAHHALGLALWFSGEPDASLGSYSTARDLNPNDTDIMADMGLRLAMLMDWERAVPLVEESFMRNPCQPTTYRIALFLYHFAEGRYDAALKQARMIDAPGIVYTHIAVATAAAEQGNSAEAREAVAKIERIRPGYGRSADADLAWRNLHPDLTASILISLRKAGLSGIAVPRLVASIA